MADVFVKLLNMSLTASVVLAVILLLRALLKNRIPRWGSSLLWLAAALALVCPFRPSSPLSVWNTTDLLFSVSSVTTDVQSDTVTLDAMHSEETAAVGEEDDLSVLSAPENMNETIDIPSDYIQVIPGQVPAQEDIYHDVPAVDYPLDVPPYVGQRVEWLSIAFVLWLSGVMGMTVYALLRYAQIKRRVAVSVPFAGSAYLCDNIDTPFVLGFFPPKIFLPSSLVDGDFCPVLAHERAHIVRGDHIRKALGWWILTAHWFNPLVWICYHCFCSDLEFACDERAVKNLDADERRSYAEALLSCSITTRRSPAFSHPLAFGEVGVRDRISAVLNYKKPGVLSCCVPVVLFAVLGVLFLTNAPDTVHDLFEQRGYGIVKIEKEQSYTVFIPTDALTDDIYSEGGREYEPNEFILYRYAPTTLYLSKIAPVRGEDDTMWIFLTFAYNDLGNQGVITTIGEPQYDGTALDGVKSGGTMAQRDVEDINTTYPNAVQGGSVAQGIELGFYIDREVLENAEGFVSFTVSGLTDLWYRRGDAVDEKDMIVTEIGRIGVDCIEIYVNNYDSQPIDLTLALEAFPNASLYADANGIYSIENGEPVTVISGMPVRNIYMSDLTGDGKPEFCATVYWGSGIVDSHIVVYDFVEKKEYSLWERGTFDFRLEMENNTLYAVVNEYNRSKDLYRDVLVLSENEVGERVLTIGRSNGEDPLMRTFENAEYYVSDRCVYMTPLSSSHSIGGDTGFRYLIDPDRKIFIQVDRRTGQISTLGSLYGGMRDFFWTDEEFSKMFMGMWGDKPDISEIYSERKSLWLGSDKYLLSMDGELWLMDTSTNPDGSEYIWSIHALVPESEKGEAWYTYDPISSSHMPHLPITLDFPGMTAISADCSDTALALPPEKGDEMLVWKQNLPQCGESQLLWRPYTEGDFPAAVEQACITVHGRNEDLTSFCAGHIYLTRDPQYSTAAKSVYRVTVVGYGLTVSQEEDGMGIVVTWSES